jgi:hypothetical protein
MLSGSVYSFFLRIFVRFFLLQTLSKVQCRSHLDAISYAIQIETNRKQREEEGKRPQPKTTKSCCDKFWFFDIFGFFFLILLPFPMKKNETTSTRERSLNLKLDGNVVVKLR